MNKVEAQAVYELANSDLDFSLVDTSNLVGYGLRDFQPVHVTIEMAAKELRYHAMQFNGQWDSVAMEEFFECAKRSFIMLTKVPDKV